MKKWLGYTLLTLAAISLAGGIALSQKKTGSSLECRDWGGDNRLQNHCEIKEQTLPAGGAITVDAGRNGGVWYTPSTKMSLDHEPPEIRFEAGGGANVQQ